MSFPKEPCSRTLASLVLPVLILLGILLAGCSSNTSTNPVELLLSPEDVPGMQLTVVSESEEQSEEGPSALVEMEGPGFRVLQSVLLFESRELALSALDGIRGDLVSLGETGPGGVETSGVLQHTLGTEKASSLFLIEENALTRLTVTGPERDEFLEQLAELAREKLDGG